MLKTRATAGRAAPVAIVEAELRCRVAALPRQWRLRKKFTHGIPCANVAGRVGTCGFTYGGLVHKHHIGQVVRTHQAVMQAGRFGRLAELAQQCRCQDVLHQGGFTGAADAGNYYQPLQRKIHRQVFQIVVARAFEDQARRVVGHRTFDAHADLLA